MEYIKLDQKAKPENKDTRRSSRHKSAESRWERLRANPKRAREDVRTTRRVRGSIGRVWIFTKIGRAEVNSLFVRLLLHEI